MVDYNTQDNFENIENKKNLFELIDNKRFNDAKKIALNNYLVLTDEETKLLFTRLKNEIIEYLKSDNHTQSIYKDIELKTFYKIASNFNIVQELQKDKDIYNDYKNALLNTFLTGEISKEIIFLDFNLFSLEYYDDFKDFIATQDFFENIKNGTLKSFCDGKYAFDTTLHFIEYNNLGPEKIDLAAKKFSLSESKIISIINKNIIKSLKYGFENFEKIITLLEDTIKDSEIKDDELSKILNSNEFLYAYKESLIKTLKDGKLGVSVTDNYVVEDFEKEYGDENIISKYFSYIEKLNIKNSKNFIKELNKEDVFLVFKERFEKSLINFDYYDTLNLKLFYKDVMKNNSFFKNYFSNQAFLESYKEGIKKNLNSFSYANLNILNLLEIDELLNISSEIKNEHKDIFKRKDFLEKLKYAFSLSLKKGDTNCYLKDFILENIKDDEDFFTTQALEDLKVGLSRYFYEEEDFVYVPDYLDDLYSKYEEDMDKEFGEIYKVFYKSLPYVLEYSIYKNEFSHNYMVVDNWLPIDDEKVISKIEDVKNESLKNLFLYKDEKLFFDAMNSLIKKGCFNDIKDLTTRLKSKKEKMANELIKKYFNDEKSFSFFKIGVLEFFNSSYYSYDDFDEFDEFVNFYREQMVNKKIIDNYLNSDALKKNLKFKKIKRCISKIYDKYDELLYMVIIPLLFMISVGAYIFLKAYFDYK